MLCPQLLNLLRPAALFLAAAATTVHAKPTHQTRVAASGYPSNGIQWKPCPPDLNGNATLKIDCGTLAVPLDYTSPNSTDTLDLSLVRVPAVKGPGKHSILFNFGGPGFEVRYTLAELADMLQAVTGGEHDLIGWDPRGTAETLTFSCFPDASSRSALLSQLVLGNSSDVAHGELWAGGKNFADACAEYPEAQKRAGLISTAFTARDAIQIVDAVEEDGLLRYWGLSYGTVLGSTLAAMFPDRVERVLIDGVLNPIQYYYESADTEAFAAADATFSEFFRQCLSTPKACALAASHPNATAEQLESASYALIEELKYRPIAYNGFIIDYTLIKTIIRFTLYSPLTWLNLGNILDAFLTQPRNVTHVGEALVSFIGSSSLIAEVPADDAPSGIECVDKEPRLDSFDAIEPGWDSAQSVSRLLGDTLAAIFATAAQWKLEPRERYEGRFVDVKTRKPLLVIGNTFDSATPLKSAKNISTTLEGSVLLEHGGFGHSSISQPSLCTAKAIQNFFRNGVLPEPNTVCPPVAPPFEWAVSGPTWQQLFPQLGFQPPSSNETTASSTKRDGHVKGVTRNFALRPAGIFW
ncbi:TAP-like protein-domain-containing protein [Xylariaceae sp. FL1651]|nr:TAP-like protein-domain-containing protein [Xylariaceae sp. FL1651]